MSRDSKLAAISFILLLVVACTQSPAAEYPARPIRAVVPYPPGGPTDIVARIVGQKLGEVFGQQVVIDNRAGAGGLIGTDIVAKAVPDGYTVLVTAVPHVVNPSLFSKVPYDTQRDFAPVIKLIAYTNILVVNRSLPVSSVSDLIEVAKRTPGKLNYGSGGNGTSQHLSAELFKSMAGVDIVHVPFQGGAAAMTALQSGQVSLMFETTLAALPHIKAGRVKALAVTSAEPSPLTPDLPTVSARLPGFEVTSWVGLLVPSGTPSQIVARLNLEANRLLQSDEVETRIAQLGGVPAGGSPQELGKLITAELRKWGDVVKRAHMKVD